jgi:hypothetical protein
MPSLRSILGSLRRGAAAVAVLGLAASPLPLAAATTGHCAGRHQAHAGHAATTTHSGAVAGAMGTGMPADCPHCASARCAVLAPCAGGLTAVGTGTMPALVVAIPVRATLAPAAAGLRSLALAPPTPPPLPIA